MKPIQTYKNYSIISFEEAPKLGHYIAKYALIKNNKTNKEFRYLVKISGTLEGIRNINSDKKFINLALSYIKDLLDKKVESEQEILITTYSEEEKKAKGIFYTPREVVEFIFDILKIWKLRQKTRWYGKNPSVIDPAAGEGGFLKVAIEKDFTKPDWVFGIDIDINAVKKWKEVNLLKEFGGNENDLEAHFFHQNGLEKIKWEQHKAKYYGKLKKKDIENEQLDCVVGNPPYGGVGLGETELTDDLIAKLVQYEILPQQLKQNLGFVNSQDDLFGSAKSLGLKPEAKQKIKSFPIEILFLDRFIQLAKPDGWIAIIIPDGILANSNSHYVREFITHKTKVEAIVSLPRETFKKAGTSAKTSILFLRKLKKDEKLKDDYPVFLASLEKIDKKYFNEIVNFYEKYYNLGAKHMNKSNLVQITKDQTGRELVMVRADKTLREMMEEKPSSRWDSVYWHPCLENIFRNISFNLKPIGDFLPKGNLIFPDHIRQSLGEKLGYSEPIPYFRVSEFINTGFDFSRQIFVSEKAFERLVHTRVQNEDILVAYSGATLGSAVIIPTAPSKSVTGDLFILRPVGINKYYLLIFLKTKFAKKQIERFKKGVASPKISTPSLKSILVPIINDAIQKNIELDFKKIYIHHNKAIEARKKGDEMEYKENLEIAERMLKDLIKRTEEVIEGKREDIN